MTHRNLVKAKKRRYIGALLMLLLVFSTTAIADQALEVIDFQLRWHHQFQFAGYYAALEKGYYRDEGFEVHVHEADVGKTPVEEVLLGRAQYAESNSEILYARLQGKPVVALAAIFQHSASVLLARRDTGIYSAHDLIAKKVMLLNAQTDADFHAMFLHEGIQPDAIEIMPSSYDFEDLISGKVAAFNSYLTNEPFILKQRGIDYTVINPSTYGIDFYSDILFTTEQEIQQHPKRVEAFTRATLKGWQYAMAHPDEIIELLITKYHVPKTRAHLKFEAETMKTLILPDLVEIGHMSQGRWQRMANAFIDVGMGNKNFSLEGFIYNPMPNRLPNWVIPVLICSFCLLVVVLAVTQYLHRLNRRLAKADAELRATNSALSAEIEVRKRSEVALLESEERWQFAIEGAGDGVWDVNWETQITVFSKRYQEMLGFAEGELKPVASEWLERIHIDDQARVLQNMHDYLDGLSSVYAVEQRLRCKDGSYKWIYARGKVVSYTAEGKPLRLVGTHTDISERKQLEETMFFRQFSFDHVEENVFWIDSQCRILDVNESACRRIGYSREEILTMTVSDIDPNFPFEIWPEHWQALKREKTLRFESLQKCRDGKISPIEVVANYFEYAGTEYNCALVRDITERKKQEDTLIESETRMRMLFEMTSDAVMVLDEQGFFDCNHATLKMFECSCKEVFLTKHPADLSPLKQPNGDDSFTLATQHIQKAWREGSDRFEWVHKRSETGQLFTAEVLLNAMNLNGKAVLQAVVRDITERTLLLQELERQAHIDYLTGINNRAYFMQLAELELARAIRYNSKLAIFMVDMDHFKKINDTHGHKSGDLVLKKFAEICLQILREVDIIGRLGGEEFAILLPETNEDKAFEVAERLRETIAQTKVPIENGLPLNFSISIGVSSLKSKEQNLDELLSLADQALYTAKNSGRNQTRRFHDLDAKP